MKVRSLIRNCSPVGKKGQTFSVYATPQGDALISDMELSDTIDMYTVEALAKRNELEYVSIPSIENAEDIQNVVESLNTETNE